MLIKHSLVLVRIKLELWSLGKEISPGVSQMLMSLSKLHIPTSKGEETSLEVSLTLMSPYKLPILTSSHEINQCMLFKLI